MDCNIENMDSKSNVISKSASILDAIRCISDLKNGLLILFVTDEEGILCGSLTDGDIRRYLAAGGLLDDVITSAMHTDFMFIAENDSSFVQKLHKFSHKQVRCIPIVDEKMRLVRIVDLVHYKSLLPIDAVIMAGGKGERLRPLTLTTPKPLLPVGSKAIIDYNVDRLIAYGVKNISVTVNYLAEQLEEHYREPHNGVQIQCVREPKFLGTMGAVRLVKGFRNDVVLVMNSDLFTDIDFEDMYLHFMENKADMSIAAIPYTVSIPLGICDLDGRDVKGIVEKPTYNYYANAGIYMIRREMLDKIPEDEFFNAPDLIGTLVQNRNKVIRYPLNGTWIDIGSISEYQKANDLVKHINNI